MIDKFVKAAASVVGGGTTRRRTSKKTKVKAAKRLLSTVGLKAVKKYSAPARRTASRKRRRY